MHLSTDFTLSEATKSGTALRCGIDNTPSPAQIEAMKYVANAIAQPIRDYYGTPFAPNSWLRVEALEKAICWGGNNEKSSFAKWCIRRGLEVNENSWPAYFARKSHPSGEAIDIEVPGVPNIDLAYWCRGNLEFDQLILEFYNPDDPAGGWVHCSSRLDGQNRGEVLTIGKRGTIHGIPEVT